MSPLGQVARDQDRQHCWSGLMVYTQSAVGEVPVQWTGASFRYVLDACVMVGAKASSKDLDLQWVPTASFRDPGCQHVLL